MFTATISGSPHSTVYYVATLNYMVLILDYPLDWFDISYYFSTSFTTYSGSDGKETVDILLLIETPVSRSLSTVYSFYNGN